jgi:23S rRNA (adenine2503-C2)-methyltransferase
MGMGEPLANLSHVRSAVRVLMHPDGVGYSPRRITVSTCGLVDGIRDLAEHGPPVRLAVSLITAEEERRRQLLPTARGNPLRALRSALGEYQKKTGRRITFEIVLMAGVTDRRVDAESLIAFVRPLRSVVNLIPWNPVPGLPYRESRPEAVEEFQVRLKSRGVSVTRRYRRGRGIEGACGQLVVAQDRTDAPDARGR